MPTSSRPPHLPRILCLHGGGTSALIFKIQLRNLTHALSAHFNFIFLDGPYTAAAGPGVLPVFADCGPYHRWYPFEDFASNGVEAGVREQEVAAKRSREAIIQAITKDTEAGNTGDVVGVMGFSQGGRMSAGLLDDQAHGNVFPGIPEFRFGVLLCASYPPYSRPNASKGPLDWPGPKDEHGVLNPPKKEELIDLPSVHVRGLVDPHYDKGKRLSAYFEGGIKEEREFQMAHNLPQAAGDTTSGGQASTHEIRDAILKVWEQSQKL